MSKNGYKWSDDISGMKFNRWTVLEKKEKNGHERLYLCRCECGTEREVAAGSLKSGRSKSCGCIQAEAPSRIREGYRSPAYFAWVGMKTRCYNKRSESYDSYGGRGITVCDRWRDSFDAFLEDMGPRPTGISKDRRTLSLDRINVDGNYEPGNCRWADYSTQMNNRTNNTCLTVNDATKTITEWARHHGVDPNLAFTRIARGWSPVEAVTTPKRASGKLGHRIKEGTII